MGDSGLVETERSDGTGGAAPATAPGLSSESSAASCGVSVAPTIEDITGISDVPSASPDTSENPTSDPAFDLLFTEHSKIFLTAEMLIAALGRAELGGDVGLCLNGVSEILLRTLEAIQSAALEIRLPNMKRLTECMNAVSSFLSCPTPFLLLQISDTLCANAFKPEVEAAIILQARIAKVCKTTNNASDGFKAPPRKKTNRRVNVVRGDISPSTDEDDPPRRKPARTVKKPAKAYNSRSEVEVTDDEIILSEVETTPTVSNLRPQPFFVKIKENWQEFVKKLHANLANPIAAKMVGEYMKIIPKTIEDFRKVQKFLAEGKYEFSSWKPKGELPKKVLIRGLPSSITTNEITIELANKGYHATQVTNLTNKKTKTALNLFLAQIYPRDGWDQIYKLQSLMYLSVTIAPFVGSGKKQCYRCQRFNHSSLNCYNLPRCVKCGEEHLAKDCTLPAGAPLRCILCFGEHTANYSGCPENPKNKFAKDDEAEASHPQTRRRGLKNTTAPQAPAKPAPAKTTTNATSNPGTSSTPDSVNFNFPPPLFVPRSVSFAEKVKTAATSHPPNRPEPIMDASVPPAPTKVVNPTTKIPPTPAARATRVAVDSAVPSTAAAQSSASNSPQSPDVGFSAAMEFDSGLAASEPVIISATNFNSTPYEPAVFIPGQDGASGFGEIVAFIREILNFFGPNGLSDLKTFFQTYKAYAVNCTSIGDKILALLHCCDHRLMSAPLPRYGE